MRSMGFVLSPRAELGFWLRIMKEHAIFIKGGLEDKNVDLKNDAEEFRERYAMLQKMVCDCHDVGEIVGEARSVTECFLAFKLHLLKLLVECRTGRDGGSLYPLLVDHMAREAQQFLDVLDWCEKVEGGMMTKAQLVIEQEVFWLRQMSDHAKFIRGLLDPSERKFIMMADGWSTTFDRLYLQAKDLESMLRAAADGFPTVARFTSEVVMETKGLRDFKRAAEKLLCECRVLSVIAPLLADHVAREAEHFIEMVQALTKPPMRLEAHPRCACRAEHRMTRRRRRVC